MGRGLSELQKNIIKIAYLNRNKEYGTGKVTNREVLIKVYNFPFHSPSSNTTSSTPQIFNPKEIGIKRYRAASVSVVKAFNRLIKRELASREYNHGIILTVKGAKVAKTLS